MKSLLNKYWQRRLVMILKIETSKANEGDKVQLNFNVRRLNLVFT